MNTKICSRCKETKEVSQFCKMTKSRDGYQPACKFCMADSWRRSRNNKLDHYKKVQKAREDRWVVRFNQWKTTQSCLICKEDHIECLDFHHLDPAVKDGDVSDMVRNVGWNTLMNEVQKCVVLCANCHRKYHAGIFSFIEV